MFGIADLIERKFVKQSMRRGDKHSDLLGDAEWDLFGLL